MTRNKAVPHNTLLLLIILILLTPALVGAFNYRQPAYIANFYLCDRLVQKGNSYQPDQVRNTLMADNPKEAAHIVVDMVGMKGVHNPEMEILDQNGNLFSNTIRVNPVTVNNDSAIFRLAPRITGRFPEGGVYIRISDKLDSGSRTLIGMFGVMTIK